MAECAQPDTTAMAALLPCSLSFAQQLCDRASLDTGAVCVVANINTASQIVIAGQVEAVERAVELGKAGLDDERVKRAVRLDVSAPFHSPIMQPARQQMEADICRTVDEATERFDRIQRHCSASKRRGRAACTDAGTLHLPRPMVQVRTSMSRRLLALRVVALSSSADVTACLLRVGARCAV